MWFMLLGYDGKDATPSAGASPSANNASRWVILDSNGKMTGSMLALDFPSRPAAQPASALSLNYSRSSVSTLAGSDTAVDLTRPY